MIKRKTTLNQPTNKLHKKPKNIYTNQVQNPELQISISIQNISYHGQWGKKKDNSVRAKLNIVLYFLFTEGSLFSYFFSIPTFMYLPALLVS